MEMQEDLFHIYISLNQTLQLESCTSELVKLKVNNSLVHDSGCRVRFNEKKMRNRSSCISVMSDLF